MPKGKDKIVNILQALFKEGLGISVISLAELYEGVYSSKNPKKHLAALEDFVAGVVVLDVNDEVCRKFGKLRAELRAEGKLIDNFDLLIASTALCHDMKILTNNTKHFEGVGVKAVSEKDF